MLKKRLPLLKPIQFYRINKQFMMKENMKDISHLMDIFTILPMMKTKTSK